VIIPFLLLLAVHWVADFVLQTHWQASNKSKRNDALLLHVLTYTVVFAAGVAVIFPAATATAAYPAFVLVNIGLHLVTDWCTSRWSSRLWAKQDWHNFFVVIGLDQLIHQVTLGATVLYFFGSGA
jgi:hypothetical protein